MSIKVISMVWEANAEAFAGPGERLVMVALADNMNDGGHCWPSVETIGEKAGLGDRATRKHLSRLEQAGYISRRRRTRGDGTYGTYEYQANFDALAAVARPESDAHADRPPASPVTEPVAVDDRHDRATGPIVPPAQTGIDQRHTGAAQEPSVEPSNLSSSLPLGELGSFDEFYDRYPRKRHRPAALKAWSAAVKAGCDGATMIEGLDRWIDWWAKSGTESQFIPHPATFLNQRVWVDPTDEPAGNLPAHTVEAASCGCRFMAGTGWARCSSWDPDEGRHRLELVTNHG